LLPITISYDRVPEEAAFAQELAGAPKPRMRLGPLLAWTLRAFQRQIDLGRIHIACGAPVKLTAESDVHAVSDEVMNGLESATVATTFHLRAFLDRHPIDGVDVAELRSAIEERGGRVLESDLETPDNLDPIIAETFRHQFIHHFRAESASSDGPLGRFLSTVFEPHAEIVIEREAPWTKAPI